MIRVRRQLWEWLHLLLRMDPVMLLLMAVLLTLGVVFIYGAGQASGGDLSGYWIRQLFWVAIGISCFLIVACFDYRRLGSWSLLFYMVGLLLLILVHFYGKTINSARSWLELPGLPRIQPAEFMKPATILLAAWLTSRPQFRRPRIFFFLPVFVALAIPVSLICVQPDWGTALVFVPAVLSIIFVAGLPWRWIAGGVIAALLLSYPGYTQLQLHQKERLHNFFKPSEDITKTGWNAHQSLLAVGSGGTWGKGYMKGTQHVLGFLPRTVAPTDFIFSVIAEELGFVGALAVICSFIGMLLCCFRTAYLASDRLGAYLCIGTGVMWFVHMYINIGMTVRVAPIIGIPLPFVSYGGSFMVSTMIFAGFVQSVHIRHA